MTDWFTKAPGDMLAQAASEDGRSMALLYLPRGEPVDWVRLPRELGGNQVRVHGTRDLPCPRCEGDVSVVHYILEGPIHVAECPTHGFLWYRGKVLHDPADTMRIEVLDDGTVADTCTLAEFIAANETLSDEQIRSLRALAVGQSFADGGGAAAAWTVRRIA